MAMHRSVTVSIACHYAPTRVKHLAEVLRAIENWTCGHVRVHVDTNDLALTKAEELQGVIADAAHAGIHIQFHEVTGLADPFHLTWAHKCRLRDWVARGGSRTDLFIYVEDDIVLSDHNLAYFSETVDPLKEVGLIPGFLRYEMDRGRRVSVEFRLPQIVRDVEVIQISGRRFVSPAFPYWAGLMLDRDLAEEYVESDAIRIECGSQIFPGHSCRVHSAMGLCYVSPPEQLSSRFVVPVTDLLPEEECHIWHCAQNYSRTKKHNFGSIPLSKVFLAPGLGSAQTRLKVRMGASARYLKHALLRNAAKAGLTKDTTYLDRFTRY